MAIEQPTRRGLITGLGAFFCAAPAIVRATSIMPVHAIEWHAVTEIDYGFFVSEFHVSEIAFWSQTHRYSQAPLLVSGPPPSLG
jgi:hypothetical protein